MAAPIIKIPKRSVKERQQQVLEVLLVLLNSEEGMQRITTERLAKAVGVSEGALYRYYPSKTKMFEALLDNIETALMSQLKIVAHREHTTLGKIKVILYTIIEFARKNPGVTRILTGHALMFEDDILKMRVAKFFDGLELQFASILQMRKLREKRGFENSIRVLSAFLINFCEGQFLRLVRSNFRSEESQQFEKQWLLIQPLFE
ncbi:MAG: nucleoid occlusion factor SlmA [Pasteurellales bacterium]|nr:MAG: nucleoid occlusion factor SlmA [Pasteurellales bacterium]